MRLSVSQGVKVWAGRLERESTSVIQEKVLSKISTAANWETEWERGRESSTGNMFRSVVNLWHGIFLTEEDEMLKHSYARQPENLKWVN